MSTETEEIARNKVLVEEFWRAVYEVRDSEKIGAFFNPEGRYEDATTQPTPGIGPLGAARRLAIGHSPIESFDHEVHRVVAEGDTIVTEHTATWHFDTGEIIPLPFTSIHVIRDGKFDLWRDYWDVTAWAAAAPRKWIEYVMREGAKGF